MKHAIARLMAFLSLGTRPSGPALVPMTRSYTGETVEKALDRFEDACSEENYRNLAIQEQTERPDGILVRYEVRWKYSVFDNGPYSSHVAWALLVPADPGAGDPPDARFRVVAATAERHIK